MPTPYQLDTTTGQRRFSQAAAGYDSAAVLQDLIRTELLNRLDVVQLQPTVVLDLGCGTGKGSAALLARYAPLQPLKERAKTLLGLAPKPAQARVIGIDSAPGMLAAAAAHVHANPQGELLAADVCALPYPAAHADLVFASLLLPWIADPDALFAEVRRVLRPGGLFAFATLGPDTLHELRAASKAVDNTPRVLEFTDMPELARGLQQAGFAGSWSMSATASRPAPSDLFRHRRALRRPTRAGRHQPTQGPGGSSHRPCANRGFERRI